MCFNMFFLKKNVNTKYGYKKYKYSIKLVDSEKWTLSI